MRGRGDVPVVGERGEKCGHVRGAQVPRVAPAVIADIARHPMRVGPLGSMRVVPIVLIRKEPRQSNGIQALAVDRSPTRGNNAGVINHGGGFMRQGADKSDVQY